MTKDVKTMRYDCYFDASHKPELTRCAFYVERNGGFFHKCVHETRSKSSQAAESKAMFLLLSYIKGYAVKGSDVNIYGDNLGVIDSVKRGRIYSNVFDKIKRDYKVTLKHISRKRNKIAHKLSRGKKVKFKPTAPKVIAEIVPAEKKHHNLGSKSVRLDEIEIPHYVKNSSPCEEKYRSKLDYFAENGVVDKKVQINQSGILSDGYISYLILKESGAETCEVDVIKRWIGRWH